MNINDCTSSDSTKSVTDCESIKIGSQPPYRKQKGLGAILSKLFDNAQNETPLCQRERIEVDIQTCQWWKWILTLYNGGSMRKNIYLC